ncbi:molybdate ABC transporter substrate-binding protein [Roseicyclus sp. F158]|uniref:Molybdate ABC transporter substrate-binding protein n=1 Tax=Tropicimonas omnivorans TaxID=3075590 RepID=A0ABU3DIF3_9RHOB|nr:molybdate ABC transporter substrate-binding protein [Roseicyclus sp. F158]MDT0683498.1 molybdate ABC transporter substrate-binding protein [Roseicyclus sp. F158]
MWNLGFSRLVTCVATLLLLASPAAAERVTVFAAASLKTAMDEIVPLWEAASGHEAAVSLAGSSLLARQIAAGAPADLFISANAAWMDDLEARGAIAEGSRVDLLTGELVLIAPAGSGAVPLEAEALETRLGDGRLAMALVEAVPAGIYGKAALESLGLWGTLSGRVAQSDNVRAALALVAAGEAPLGIVYATDAAAEPRVEVAAQFPDGSHPDVVYPAALTAGSPEAAANLLRFLQGADARDVFGRLGFGRPR